MEDKLIRWIKWVLILVCLLILAGVVSLCIGSAGIPFRKIISVLFSRGSSVEHSILFSIRLPRIILGVVIGGALSVSGVIFQGIFRNPLVEPYTLGISGGAALAVAICVVSGLKIFLPIAGFIGALTSILVIYLIGIRSRSLLLVGVMISFIAGSLVMFIMALAGTEELHSIIFWIMGSLEEPDTEIIGIVFFFILIGSIICVFFSNSLNALSLGEEEAMHLGINVERTRGILFLLGSILTGCSVSVSGIIGFVGLVVPHFMRIFVGYDNRILIITSFLTGGIFLLVCDTLARTIVAPLELPVGVITGIIGGSVFIYFLSRRKDKC